MHPADEKQYRASGKGGRLIPLRDGDEMDLGNRRLKVIHLPDPETGCPDQRCEGWQTMPAGIWIMISAAVLALLLIGSASNGRKKPGKKGKAARVDRPHYYDRDDHECSVCGARFRQDTMTCPRCGTRFDVVKKDRFSGTPSSEPFLPS